MTIRIAMWSGPRNISTAMMRSFGGRTDCTVSDEPFYGAYLKQSGEPQPMATEIIEDMECDWHAVTAAMNGPPPVDAAIWYQKHMPHHMIDTVGISSFPDHRHAFLIREPERVIASYVRKRASVTFKDLRYDKQLAYFEEAATLSNTPPPVIESTSFLNDPEGHLKALCAALEIPWDAGMLKWEAGPRETDGIWASHWYDRVTASTEFGAPPSEMPKLTGDALKLADQCRPYYDAMRAFALTSSHE
ncbi:HAD family hydrolase [Altererythrobacter sp. RZ02]|uniref:HAD family hydrolase n=1 Tax=Pontixanthobacter rizhaonensis TaxID=2730337 RepID=A0A848QQN3_9SPHN|nr:HAD family hydrolase [Pontixanthobacter rizhaonensis]NMW31418.1 HAD family hydrolase [Pontixanthobacter rizhaonensis]